MRPYVLFLLTIACAEKGAEADWDSGSESSGVSGFGDGSGSSDSPSSTFNIAWSDDGNTLEASVSNPHVEGYFLGLAQTGSADGWYGEDCVSADSICHDMGPGSAVALFTVHPDYGGGGIDALVPGANTLFHAGVWAGVTYVFFSNEGDTAYETVAHTGGDDTSYYD